MPNAQYSARAASVCVPQGPRTTADCDCRTSPADATQPLCSAYHNGVRPHLSLAYTSAPASSNIRTSRCLRKCAWLVQARCRGVELHLLCVRARGWMYVCVRVWVRAPIDGCLCLRVCLSAWPVCARASPVARIGVCAVFQKHLREWRLTLVARLVQ